METTNKWLLTIFVLLPTYLIRFELFGLSLNLLDVFIGSGFLYCLVHYRGVRLSRAYWFAAVSFLLIGLVAVVVSNTRVDALGLYKSYIVAPILVGAMIQTIRPKFEHVLQALGYCVLFVAGIALIQWLTGYGVPAPWHIGGVDVRMTSIFEYPNAVGLLAAPIVAMSMAWLVHERRHRLFFLLVSASGILAIGLSQSDGAVVAVMAAVGFTLIFTRYRTAVISLCVLALAVALLLQPTQDVLLLHDTSGEVRRAMWQGTVELIKDRPLLGAGLANFQNVYPNYKLDRHVEALLYPHNIILDFWVELGLAGVIWLLLVVGRFFVRGVQDRKHRHQIVLMSGMVAMLVYGLVDVPYFKNDLAVVFWTLLALGEIIPKFDKSVKK